MNLETDRSIITINGERAWATDAECEALRMLSETRKGGFATVHGYVPKSNWMKEKRPVQDIQFLSRFSVSKLYQRRIDAIMDLQFDDLADAIAKDSKLSEKSDSELREIFVARKMKEVEAMTKTLNGVRDNAHRQAHDRNYIHVSEGVKVNLVSEMNEDGFKIPVLRDGVPTVKSIMILAIFLNVKTLVEGERKYTNSGAPVRMSNAITATLNRPGLDIRTLSLQPGNWQSITIDGEELLTENLHPDVATLLTE